MKISHLINLVVHCTLITSAVPQASRQCKCMAGLATIRAVKPTKDVLHCSHFSSYKLYKLYNPLNLFLLSSFLPTTIDRLLGGFLSHAQTPPTLTVILRTQTTYSNTATVLAMEILLCRTLLGASCVGDTALPLSAWSTQPSPLSSPPTSYAHFPRRLAALRFMPCVAHMHRTVLMPLPPLPPPPLPLNPKIYFERALFRRP